MNLSALVVLAIQQKWEKKMKTDKLVGFILFFFALIMLFYAFRIEEMTNIKGISSRLWPMLVLLIIVFLSLMLILKGGNQYIFPWQKFLGCLAFFLGYIFALQLIGYIPATLFFQVIFLPFLGIKDKKRIMIFSTVTTTIFAVIFKVLLNVLLPLGIGIFRDFNILLLG